MLISTKGRYAIRIMADVAAHDGDTPVSVREIAGRQNISEKYMEQIVHALVKANLLRSIRGAQGGYHLAALPEEITAGQILRATEGDMAPVQCIAGNGKNACENSGACPSQAVFRRVYSAINEVIDTVTLAQVAEDVRTGA